MTHLLMACRTFAFALVLAGLFPSSALAADPAAQTASSAAGHQRLADLLEKKSRSINDEDVEVRRSKLLRFAASRGFETELVFRILKEIES